MLDDDSVLQNTVDMDTALAKSLAIARIIVLYITATLNS